MRIKRDKTRDLFWLVTGDSIAYLTDDFKVKNVTDFPYTNNYDLFQNSRDEMWVLSSNGIYVAPTAQMLGNEEITPKHYGIDNGLTRIATSNSFNEFTENGDLYISGNTGVTKVNIETAFSKTPEIRASIQYIDADDNRIYPDEDGNFYLSSDVKKITIHGFVFNYSLFTPDTSYCLEGFSTKYTNAGFNNNISVDYTNLSGGDYGFVLKVIQSDGTECAAARVTIIKEKAIYEQPWFYVIIIIADILLICVIIQIIMHFRIKKMKAKHKEEVEKERITTELETATNIQTGMLPSVFPPFPDRNEFDLFASMDPAKEVGEDFYDFFMIDDDHLGLVIADVSGKGVPAALVMMASKIMIADYAKMNHSPENILRAANDSICENNSEEMFVTAWVGILEISTGKLTAASAGHEYPAIKQPDGKFELFKDKRSMALGFMPGTKYHNYELQLKPGTKLFVYTDGVPEATDAAEELFGTERMIEALNKDADASPEQILKNVCAAVDLFVKEAEQFDDLTMLCIEYKKSDAEDLTVRDSE